MELPSDPDVTIASSGPVNSSLQGGPGSCDLFLRTSHRTGRRHRGEAGQGRGGGDVAVARGMTRA